MKEYFIAANSFAAPIVSDKSQEYVKAENPRKALETFRKNYNHLCGLYAANVYKNADAWHKGKTPLAKYRHPKAQKREKKYETS